MSRRGVAGQDDPGAFQALRDEVVAPFRRLLHQTTRGVGVALGSQQPQQQGEQQKHQAAAGQGGGVEARRPLQAITNQPGGAQRPVLLAPDARRDRLALASAVYEVSYLSGCLAFPWDLAMPELNALKEAAVARRRRQPTPQKGAAATEQAVERPPPPPRTTK